MFKNPFSFNGRIRRTEYGISFIIYLIGYGFIEIMAEGVTGIKAFALLWIPLLWFFWAQGAKRCHDLGKSGWWQIIPFYCFWLLFEKGKPWPNEYDVSYKKPGYPFSPEDYVDPYPVHPVGTPLPEIPGHENPEPTGNEDGNPIDIV
jgi:hypothetical protein